MSAGTVFCVLTPSGRGAVAVIAVAGLDAVQSVGQFFIAKNRKSLDEQPLTRIVYGTWRSDGEDLIVCRREPECVEIHCHGGLQAVSKIAGDLRSVGCDEIPWQQSLARNDSCFLRVEAQVALAHAVSTRSALILLEQYHGALARELGEIARLLRSESDEARPRLNSLLKTAELGSHLTRPWQVVIAGWPNVGKSSLINALVGYRRAIVFDQPGTTRDVITASTVIDGWPVTLSDTAGLHAADDPLEAAGIELAKDHLAGADLMVWVLDASAGVADYSAVIAEQFDELGSMVPPKRLVVLNKIDCASGVSIPAGVIGTSATTGAGIEQLLAAISATLVPYVPDGGAPVVFTERQRERLEAACRLCKEGSRDRTAPVDSLLNPAYFEASSQ